MAEDKEYLDNAPMENSEPEPGEDDVIYREKKRLLFLGLPWTFTRYTITPSVVTINQGLFTTTEDDCYMYKIQDVKLTTTLMERLAGLGTVNCYTGDSTTPQLILTHIKHAKEIKTYLLKESEKARLKRRTLNTMNIGAGLGPDMDHNGIPDYLE